MAESKWKNMKAEDFFGKEQWEQIVEALKAEEAVAEMNPGELELLAATAEPVELDELLNEEDSFSEEATHRGLGIIQ